MTDFIIIKQPRQVTYVTCCDDYETQTSVLSKQMLCQIRLMAKKHNISITKHSIQCLDYLIIGLVFINWAHLMMDQKKSIAL